MKNDPELWDANLDWLLNCSSSAMGQRGTTAAVIAAIERGGASGSCNLDELMLERIGYGQGGTNAVTRERRLRHRWAVLPTEHARVLAVHYAPRRAGDKAEQHVGFCARVAVVFAADPAALLRACDRVTDGGAADTRREARERAEKAVRAAHRAWRTTAIVEAKAWAEAAE